jgi:3-methyl-2-oxobutanoate hydroxymethyltransferase
MKIISDARAVAEAGAFSIVVEGVVEPLAREVTNSVVVPTIGIGASAECDGQVLVTEDMVGLFNDFTPSFVKRYADLGSLVGEAAEAYGQDVRARRFPAAEHCFKVKNDKT